MNNDIEKLRDYIREETGSDEEIADDLDLLEAELLDSFSIIQLAAFIQDEFSLELEPDDLVRDNLYCLNAMNALIEKRRR